MWPKEFTIIMMAALPVVEARLAIPFAILVEQINPINATVLAFIGSLIPALFVTPFIYRFGETMKERVPVFANLLSRTQARHGARFDGGKRVALFVLVAIPVPLSGVWTGILAAYLFGIRQRDAIPLLAAGSLISSIGVGLLVAGASGLFGF